MRKIAIRFAICSTLLFLASACTGANSAPPPPDTTEPTAATRSLTLTPTLTATPSPTPPPSATPTATPHGEIAPTLPHLPQVQFIYHGSREKPYVALTFDLCQLPTHPSGFEPQIVETLRQYNAPATFFLGGDWMRTHPAETLLLAANPRFELGNHSWSHPDFRSLGWREMGAEIVKTQNMLYKLTGREAHLFRLPYGYYNNTVLNVIAQHGLTTIQWDTETGDPDPNLDAAAIQRAAREGAQNGSIIIMHANGFGWHTAEALPGVLEYLRSQGYTLVTVSQLIGLEPMPGN